MANISDVYDIKFECDSEELAIALLAYFKKLEATPAEYNTTSEAERNGTTINGGWASGRWVYESNLRGTFERPEEWLGDTLPKNEWEAVLDLLKSGEKIDFEYSEDEPGCEVFVDGAGQIAVTMDNKVSVSLDYVEHDRPDCMMESDGEGGFYCEDHDHTQAESARHCEVAQ